MIRRFVKTLYANLKKLHTIATRITILMRYLRSSTIENYVKY